MESGKTIPPTTDRDSWASSDEGDRADQNVIISPVLVTEQKPDPVPVVPSQLGGEANKPIQAGTGSFSSEVRDKRLFRCHKINYNWRISEKQKGLVRSIAPTLFPHLSVISNLHFQPYFRS